MLLNPSIVKKSQTQTPTIMLYLFPTEVYDEGDEEDFVSSESDDDEEPEDEILVEHDWEEVDDDEDDGNQDDEYETADNYGAYRSYSAPNRCEFVLNT